MYRRIMMEYMEAQRSTRDVNLRRTVFLAYTRASSMLRRASLPLLLLGVCSFTTLYLPVTLRIE